MVFFFVLLQGFSNKDSKLLEKEIDLTNIKHQEINGANKYVENAIEAPPCTDGIFLRWCEFVIRTPAKGRQKYCF
jgi:hypothetical protein